MPKTKIAVCFVLGVLLEGTVNILFKKCKILCAHTLQGTCEMSHSVELVKFPTETQGQKTGHGLLCRPDGRSSCFFGEVCLPLDAVHLCIFWGGSRRFFLSGQSTN